MSLLTDDQLSNIVALIIDDYGTQLTNGDVSEVIGLILENISGFETFDSQRFTQQINQIRTVYYDSVS